MVVVKIELWPHGDESKATPLGQMNITNDGTGSAEVGSYRVDLLHAGRFYGRPGTYKKAVDVRYQRSLSPYHLLAKSLAACGIK